MDANQFHKLLGEVISAYMLFHEGHMLRKDYGVPLEDFPYKTGFLYNIPLEGNLNRVADGSISVLFGNNSHGSIDVSRGVIETRVKLLEGKRWPQVPSTKANLEIILEDGEQTLIMRSRFDGDYLLALDRAYNAHLRHLAATKYTH